ncbi:MAG: hypothetical protein LQ349_004752 [Xanthoria aureola]|nr:MAG: hypothetical protein LQ349_004752 [Xanthoria aureola]
MATTTINAPRDPNTLSNYNNFLTQHTSANFAIDFEKRRLDGNVILKLISISDSETKDILLDTSHVDVQDVSLKDNNLIAKWQLLPRFEPYGSALKISLKQEAAKGQTFELDIRVQTTDKCTALQWLTPAQTSNKKHPYMFSQCQAIHARSIFPCQDTPDVKSAFDFNIRSPLPVIASGLATGVVSEDTGSGTSLYTFKQDIPIPSYLFALASGDIATAPIGPRSVVATGPEELSASKWELEADTERFIQVGESLVYDYAWTTYNVLILPPSFPYGGMENPVFTFATPTIISGDRQNVDVIAHELSHSWSGNLVSNASWEHFWLNEGWTTYLERRIQAAVHGEPHRDFSAIIGWKALSDSVQEFGEDHEFTKLVIDLKGKDPDDAFSSVPYEKGFHFLYHLEKLLGKEAWDEFIPHYFSEYKGKSLDSYDFKSTVLEFFERRRGDDATATQKLAELDWDAWFYRPGLPPKPHFDTSMVDVCYALADKWKTFGQSGQGGTGFQPAAKDIEGWMANQVVVLLERIQDFETPLSAEAVHVMGSRYGFVTSRNVEVVARYLAVGLKAKSQEVLEPTAELLGRVGRMKFVRPLYRRLNEVDRELAVRTFEKNRDFYHPICRAMVEKDLFGT